jgi:hypothetical protein
MAYPPQARDLQIQAPLLQAAGDDQHAEVAYDIRGMLPNTSHQRAPEARDGCFVTCVRVRWMSVLICYALVALICVCVIVSPFSNNVTNEYFALCGACLFSILNDQAYRWARRNRVKPIMAFRQPTVRWLHLISAVMLSGVVIYTSAQCWVNNPFLPGNWSRACKVLPLLTGNGTTINGPPEEYPGNSGIDVEALAVMAVGVVALALLIDARMGVAVSTSKTEEYTRNGRRYRETTTTFHGLQCHEDAMAYDP